MWQEQGAGRCDLHKRGTQEPCNAAIASSTSYTFSTVNKRLYCLNAYLSVIPDI